MALPGAVYGQELSAFSQKIQQAYEQAGDLSMEFVQQTYVALLDKQVRKTGSAQFKKPGKFLIRYEGAGGRQYLSNGKELYVFEAGDRQFQKYTVNEETVPSEALSFLGGLGNLSQDFAVEEVDPKTERSLKKIKPNLRWLELTPLKKRSTIQKLIMGFDKENALVQELFIFSESGNMSHYVFEKVAANTGLKDEIFEWKR
jgi:outer membrane lipoprotein-sorting protein